MSSVLGPTITDNGHFMGNAALTKENRGPKTLAQVLELCNIKPNGASFIGVRGLLVVEGSMDGVRQATEGFKDNSARRGTVNFGEAIISGHQDVFSILEPPMSYIYNPNTPTKNPAARALRTPAGDTALTARGGKHLSQSARISSGQ